MEEDSFGYDSQTRDEGSSKAVGVSRLSAERRRDILENLKREREKRKETVRRGDHFQIESTDFARHIKSREEPKELVLQDNSCRSELINRLIEERRRGSLTQSLESTKAADSHAFVKQAAPQEPRSQPTQIPRSPRTPSLRHVESCRSTKENEIEQLSYLYDNYVKSQSPKAKPAVEHIIPQKRKEGTGVRSTSVPTDKRRLLREELQKQVRTR
jgi:hypothetical protein